MNAYFVLFTVNISKYSVDSMEMLFSSNSWRHYIRVFFVDMKKHRSAEIMTDMMKYGQYSEKKCLLPQFLIQAKFNSGIIDEHI